MIPSTSLAYPVSPFRRGEPARLWPSWRCDARVLWLPILVAAVLGSAAFGQRPNVMRRALPFGCDTPAAWIPKRIAPAIDQNGNFVEDELEFGAEDPVDVMLCLNDCPKAADLAWFASFGTIGYVSPYTSVVQLQGVSIASALVLGQDSLIAFVELDGECTPLNDVSVPAIKVATSTEYAGENLEDVYPNLDGSGVNIAVIDSGIDFGHETLPLWKFVGGWDFTLATPIETDPDDQMGHGTHVAGIAAGTGGPNGPRGVAPGAGLVDIRVFGATGGAPQSRVVAAIDKCIERRHAWNIRVINLSLGSTTASAGDDAQAAAANRAVQAGIVVCASTGNDNLHKIASPAAADHVIAVGATDDQGTIDRTDDVRWEGVFGNGGSNFGPRLDDGDSDSEDELKPTCAAPGRGIRAPQFNTTTGYVEKTGTSMACPHVAGLAAILIQFDPARTPDQVRSSLIVGSTGWEPELGYGEVDAFRPFQQQGTERVSVDSAGNQGNGASAFPSISPDGRFVAFRSDASNLVPGDTNGSMDVFVRDRQTGATTRVSVSSSGIQGDRSSFTTLWGCISADGRFVAFESEATNLVAGDTNNSSDIFIRDRQTGATTRVSVSTSGVQGNDWSHLASISADGRYVAFDSFASNLVPGDTNGIGDVFVHDRQTGATQRVSVSSSGTQAAGLNSAGASISADGRLVAFASGASNLVSGDSNNARDIFVHDRQTGATTRVSVSSSGVQANARSGEFFLSPDGRYVAFDCDATNLVPGDTNSLQDIFVRDRQTGATTRVSVSSSGVQANANSFFPSLSADGRLVSFYGSSNNLVPGDTNGKSDVFLHDRQTGTTLLVSVDSAGNQGNQSSSGASSISADGRSVAFSSQASNLVSDDTNGTTDLFVRILQ